MLNVPRAQVGIPRRCAEVRAESPALRRKDKSFEEVCEHHAGTAHSLPNRSLRSCAYSSISLGPARTCSRA